MRTTLTTSSAHHPRLALPSALDQTPPSPPSPISPMSRPAHASDTASPGPASASSSTAVDPAAATPTRSPAAHLLMRSTSQSPPAAKESLSATRRPHPFNREIEENPLLACKLCSQTQDLMTLGIHCSRFLDTLFVQLIIRHQSGID